MPRKRKEQPDNFNKAFPIAMRKLMERDAITQNELAEHLGKTRQSISYYCDGSSSPDWETIVKIADYFNVSSDYLLGRTEDPARLPSIVDDLMLSKKAVDAIESLQMWDTPNYQITFRNASGRAIDVLNCLLESADFEDVMGYLLLCLDSFMVNTQARGLEGDDYEAEAEMRNAGQVVLCGADAGKFYAAEAANALKHLVCKELPILAGSFTKSK